MSDTDRNEAVEKIIGNMTAENGQDGHYNPLGFTPPPATTDWNQPQYSPNYHYHPAPDLPPGFTLLAPYPTQYHHPQPTPHHYMNDYHKAMSTEPMNNLKYMYNAPDAPQPEPNGIFPPDFLHHAPAASLRDHPRGQSFFDWVQNTPGTYSPFGNVDHFKPSAAMFEHEPIPPEPPADDAKPFPFAHAPRKPRMVAEVKPMRPSYSDVLLTKPAVVRPPRSELKEAKPKGPKKGGKAAKPSALSRSNTNGEFKDLPPMADRSGPKAEKRGGERSAQLNRKWASLDNINEPMSNAKIDEGRKKKSSDESIKHLNIGAKLKKANVSAGNQRNLSDVQIEAESSSSRNSNESFNVSKNGASAGKKAKPNGNGQRQKHDAAFGGTERPPGGKRNNRGVRKRENSFLSGFVGMKLKQYLKGWWKIITVFIFWLIHLISDVCSLSLHISRDIASNLWVWFCAHWSLCNETVMAIVHRVQFFSWIYEKLKKTPKEKPSDKDSNNRSFLHAGLQNNINMPTTGDEAMKRLLACKGKDPYSILGVTPTCTDDDIKKYYKKQAFLVHPDKNQQPGAEEAFKILVHAFDMIGVPEKRATYDKGVVESAQVEQAWSELNELLTQLQQKVEAAANTICCSACGQRHKRIKIERPCYAARNCAQCQIRHTAREGDIWAEARFFGFIWNYYACMKGEVYDITEWAGCQKESLKHLRPDTHQVQYRIALGKQNQQSGARHSPAAARSGEGGGGGPPNFENLLNTLYGQVDGMGQTGGTRRRNKKAANK